MSRSIMFVLATVLFSTQLFAKGSEWVYVVSEGDNLWNISKKYLTKVTYFEDIRKFNNINTPKNLQPGTLIKIPLEWVVKKSANVTIKSLSGENSLYRNNQLLNISTQTTFTLGDELRVGKDATITLVFADGSEMTLSDNVIVVFDHLSHYGKTGMVDTRVRISQGKMEIRAAKQMGIASRLDIATASAITSVRGTVFRVGVDQIKSANSLVEVIEGEVAVTQDSKSVSIPQGFGIKVEEGKELSKPVKLLNAPELIQFESSVKTEQALIRWSKIENASAYNLSISKDNTFSNILWQQQTTSMEYKLPELADGIYYLRLSAQAKNGLEGLPRDNIFELNAFPKPPRLINSSVIHVNGSQTLQWQTLSTSNNGVLFQLSSKQDFSELIVSNVLNTTQFRPTSELPTGNYFWRLAAIEKHGALTHGPFSEVNKFTYSLLLPPPKFKASLKNQMLVLTWNEQQPDEYMEFQISENKNFIAPKKKVIKSANKVVIEVSEDDVLYLRGRARLINESEPGEWSKPCKVSVHSGLAICRV